MPLLWLRIALVLYGVGLLYALMALTRRSHALDRFVFPCVGSAMVLQLVSIIETAHEVGQLAPNTVHDVESLLALILMFFFMAIYARYRTLSPGILIFPVVFLLTFGAAIGKQPPHFASPLLRNGWIFVHIALIFTGYAALLFSFAASLLYLLQERGIKSKQVGLLTKLPALEVIDDIGYKSLLLGFPFMTFGLLAGAFIAASTFGPTFFRDPKVLLSTAMWAVYMVLLWTRWNAGWRGRRAAFLNMVVFLVALGAFAANYFSGVHGFIVQ
jgi:ABC-type uncharacterized transport system permease subunit